METHFSSIDVSTYLLSFPTRIPIGILEELQSSAFFLQEFLKNSNEISYVDKYKTFLPDDPGIPIGGSADFAC
jgi:hypothetical protein